MLEKLNADDIIKFSKVTPEEKESRGILGRLSGPIASCVVPTRNGRRYSDKLWENVFKSDLVQELFENGGLPGELDHPADRSETDTSRIAVMMPNPPKKDDKGQLIASLDIVDTPCGKIAYQLAKYGFKFGISSRGEGDFTEDFEGNQIVDPNTYELKAFDLVLLPAVKEARLTMTESLNKKKYNKTLKESLQKLLIEASDEDREVMEDTLKDLDMHLDEEAPTGVDEESGVNASTTEEPVEEVEVESNNDTTEDNVKDTEVSTQAECESDAISKLLEIVDKLLKKEELNDSDLNSIEEIKTAETHESTDEKDLESSEEKEPLDIEDGKIVGEISEVDDNESDDEMIEQFQELLKAKKTLEENLMDLQNKLAVSDAKVNGLLEELNRYKNVTIQLSNKALELKNTHSKMESLQEAYNKLKDVYDTSKTRLDESLKREDDIKVLNEKLEISNSEISNLNDQISDLKSTIDLKESMNAKKLEKAKTLIKNYKLLANNTMTRYIESKANMIGVTPNEIKNRLDESYTVDDVDKICDSLTTYKVNLSKLPINISNNVKMRVKESANESLSIKSPYDDIIDEELIALAKI